MDFIPLSSLKSKQVKAPAHAREAIEDYARYISSQKGADFHSSDIVTKVLLDDSFQKEIGKAEETKVDKISLRLPETAWNSFEQLSSRGKLSQEEMFELISSKLMKDKKFISWRKNSGS